MTRAAVVLALAMGAAGPVHAASQAAPYAVMPFKNIGGGEELAWLSLGMAETMVSDLKKEKFAVVERDQVGAALAELKLQQSVNVDASTAAKVGKIVGARTVVIGGYQTAGQQLRITARFVDVQTGVVRQTAKATGKVGAVFALQDRIVSQLTGRKVQVRRHRATPKRAKKGASAAPKKVAVSAETMKPMLDAYRLYSESLGQSDPMARRVALLQSLQADPGFAYALDELDALELRLAAYKKQALREVLARIDAAIAIYRDATRPDEDRAKAAMDAMRDLQVNRQYTALLEVCQEIVELQLPPYYTMNISEYALHACFTAHQQLVHTDEAMRVGEQFLKTYPGSQLHQSVTLGVEQLIKQQRERKKLYAAYDEELAELEERAAGFRARDERRPNPERLAGQLVQVESQRCSLLARHYHVEEAERHCKEFIDAHAGEERADPWVYQARVQLFFLYRNLGRFDDARRIGADLIVHHGDKGADVADTARWFPR